MTVNALSTLFYKTEFGLWFICFSCATPDIIIRSSENVPLKTEYLWNDPFLVFPLSNELFPLGFVLATEVQNWLCVHLRDHWCVVWKAPQHFRLSDFKSSRCPHFLTRATHLCTFVPWQDWGTVLLLTQQACLDSGHVYRLLPNRARNSLERSPTPGFSNCFQLTSFPQGPYTFRPMQSDRWLIWLGVTSLLQESWRPGEGCHSWSILQPIPKGLQERDCQEQAGQILLAGSKWLLGCRQSILLFANCKSGLWLKANLQHLVFGL